MTEAARIVAEVLAAQYPQVERATFDRHVRERVIYGRSVFVAKNQFADDFPDKGYARLVVMAAQGFHYETAGPAAGPLYLHAGEAHLLQSGAYPQKRAKPIRLSGATKSRKPKRKRLN
jgi:hypothetical protein